MTQPEAKTTELDGALGVQPGSSGLLLAIVGPASSGPIDVPSTFARSKDLIATHGAGPLVEAAALHIEKKNLPVVVVRTGNTVAGTVSAVTKTGTGTSVVTVAASPTPADDFDLYVVIVTGGTRGTAGITYQYSLDGGRTLSPVQALGVATSIAIPGAGGVSFDIAAGTLATGDTISARTTAPSWNSSEITSALTALRNSSVGWEIVQIVGPIDATTFDAIDLAVTGMAARHKYRAWVGNVRMPSLAESEATYLSSLSAAFGSKSTVLGNLCAGACKLTSAVSGRKYRRPISFAVASQEASVAIHKNIAQIAGNQLVGVAITDANGNPDEHDESVYPGLDDARFTTLRTWEGKQGVYVNLSRVFSPDGSDFRLFTHRRVMNVGRAVVRSHLLGWLNREIVVDAATGYISEADAQLIEKGVERDLESTLRSAPSASSVSYVLNRNDNLLSTRKLTGRARIVPLGYPESIETEIGFENPALVFRAV